MSTGQERTYQVQAVDQARPLKVTLVWTDAPSLSGAGAALQNQLYLQVRRPTAAWSTATCTAFPTVTNNVQQVVIAAPAPAPTTSASVACR